MRRLLLAAAAATFPVLSVCADEMSIPGFMSSNGAFRPALRVRPQADGPRVLYQGTYVLKLTIALKTATIPKAVKCSVRLEVLNFDGTYTDAVDETGTDTADINGRIATCSPKVDYKWSLYLGSQDSISVSYSLVASTGAVVQRQSNQSVETIAVPANGTTTTTGRTTSL